MFAHLYTEQTEMSLEDIVKFGEDVLNTDFRRYSRVLIRASELIQQPSKIIALNEMLLLGRRCNQLIILVNDVPPQPNHSSLKHALHRHVDDAYKNNIDELDRLIKSNTVAI